MSTRKTGSDHWRYNKTHSTGTRILMSQAKTGIKHPKFKGYYITPAGRFTNSLTAGKANNVANKTVIARCNNPMWKHFGWFIKPYKNKL